MLIAGGGGHGNEDALLPGSFSGCKETDGAVEVIKAHKSSCSEENWTAIDIIGGTSMVSLIGALYSSSVSYTRTYQRVKQFSQNSRWWHYLTDTTVPVLAVTSGDYFTRTVAAAMGEELDSSDLRLTFYCNVTNLSKGCRSQIMYPQGRPVWQMVRASMGVPGVFPPFAMGGEGDLLVDGCFSANVPVFPALTLGAEIVFAFDVSEMRTPPSQCVGSSLSGWRLAMNLVFQCCLSRHRHPTAVERKDSVPPGSRSDKIAVTGKGTVLTGPRVLGLLSFSTNMNELRAIRRTPECLYNRPPVTDIGAFAMDMIDEAQRLGYENAKQGLYELKKSGRLDNLALSRSSKHQSFFHENGKMA